MSSTAGDRGLASGGIDPTGCPGNMTNLLGHFCGVFRPVLLEIVGSQLEGLIIWGVQEGSPTFSVFSGATPFAAGPPTNVYDLERGVCMSSNGLQQHAIRPQFRTALDNQRVKFN
ncbi:hypothetical protein CPC08DRAFT_771172 [Agrocybe pediades]|nr:hypothetical protein CPC08DRAFT_771172 [Agrocybe pediades]